MTKNENENLLESIRGGQMSSTTNQQAKNIYSNGNYEEETKSIEFFDDEESFYIMRRSPEQHSMSNTSNAFNLKLTFFNSIIWISLFKIFKIFYRRHIML